VRFRSTEPETGTLLLSSEVRENFKALDRAAQLRPVPGHEVDPGAFPQHDMYIWVESGCYAADTASTKVFSEAFSPILVAPVVLPRTDLVYINSGGNLVVLQGVEGFGPPTYPSDVVAVAEVTLVVGQTVIVTGDIKDVRPMFVIQPAGFGINPDSEVFTATASQMVFTLTQFQYVPGADEILVFAGGVYKTVVDDYIESAVNTITFNTGRPSGEKVTIYRVGAANAHNFADLDDITVDIADAVKDTGGFRTSPADLNNPLATLADISGSIPFAVEHNATTGEHGPHVNIIQPNNDTALTINKSGVGAGNAIAISNTGTGVAISVVQSGNAGSMSISQIGIGNAIAVSQTGTGAALSIVQAGTGKAISITYNVAGATNYPLSISRLVAAGTREPLVNLHETGGPTGANFSIYSNELSFADELTNTRKFTFNVSTGECTIASGGNNNRLSISKATLGTGNSIEIAHSGTGHAINIGNSGSGNSLRINTAGVGVDIFVVGAPNGGILDPLWGGPSSNADIFHTHTIPQVLTDLTDVSNDEAAAFNSANAPTALNPFATIADITSAIPKIKFSSYVGNGTTQSIALGFQPDWVQVYNSTNNTHSGVYVARTATGRFFSTSGTANITITATGFDLNDGTGPLNAAANTYFYLATKGNA